MKKAKLHAQESRRLTSLKNLNIIDTVAETEFDDIIYHASQICKTPIALISLIDESRQWFKSKIGLNISETSRDVSFCTHTILQDEIFEVKDTHLDDRFFDNPLVLEDPQIRFYAGVPLLSPTTCLPIGTLCVIDRVPRALNPDQLKALKFLSGQIQKLLELRLQVSMLKEFNEKLSFHKTAFAEMAEGIIFQNSEGRVIDYNPSALKILELTDEKLMGKRPQDSKWKLFREDGSDFPKEEHPSLIALSKNQTQEKILLGIEVLPSKIKWLTITSTPLILSTNTKLAQVVTTFSDVTAQKQAQQTFIQSAKMTSLGEMAGGIAHEINTPLAIVCTAATQVIQLLDEEELDRDRINKRMELIDSTAQRIGRIVKGLRTFARPSENDPWVDIPVEHVLSDAVALCSEKFKNSGIKIEIFGDQSLIINGIGVQLSQVILNLLSNSHDAIYFLNEKWVSLRIESCNEMVKILIIDSGKGINPSIQGKIMQPFFTTKEVGKGTGLGLSISKSIIETFKGRFFYEPNCENTCFVVELPLIISSKTKECG